MAFSEKAKSYLLDMFWMGEETGKKATAFDVAFQMKRRDRPENVHQDRLVDRATDRLILEPTFCPE